MTHGISICAKYVIKDQTMYIVALCMLCCTHINCRKGFRWKWALVPQLTTSEVGEDQIYCEVEGEICVPVCWQACYSLACPPQEALLSCRYLPTVSAITAGASGAVARLETRSLSAFSYLQIYETQAAGYEVVFHTWGYSFSGANVHVFICFLHTRF